MSVDFMCLDVLSTCMFMYHVHAVPIKSRKHTGSLGLELQMAVSPLVGAGITPRSSGRAGSALPSKPSLQLKYRLL